MAGDQEMVLKRVRAALEHDTRINLHRCPIHLKSSNDDLILEGETESIAAKKLALELAAAVHGVSRIVDRLRVRPAERMSDAVISERIRDALMGEPAFESCSIRIRTKEQVIAFTEPASVPSGDIRLSGDIVVEVEDGVVFLNGSVPSLSHKRLAGVLAWWVPGSRDVINGLEEVPPEEDNDEEVTDAVRLALEKDPFVNADRIRVSTRNYVVTLEGCVLNKEVKDMAEFDAWYVFGVDRVVNKLSTEE